MNVRRTSVCRALSSDPFAEFEGRESLPRQTESRRTFARKTCHNGLTVGVLIIEQRRRAGGSYDE